MVISKVEHQFQTDTVTCSRNDVGTKEADLPLPTSSLSGLLANHCRNDSGSKSVGRSLRLPGCTKTPGAVQNTNEQEDINHCRMRHVGTAMSRADSWPRYFAGSAYVTE